MESLPFVLRTGKWDRGVHLGAGWLLRGRTLLSGRRSESVSSEMWRPPYCLWYDRMEDSSWSLCRSLFTQERGKKNESVCCRGDLACWGRGGLKEGPCCLGEGVNPYDVEMWRPLYCLWYDRIIDSPCSLCRSFFAQGERGVDLGAGWIRGREEHGPCCHGNE